MVGKFCPGATLPRFTIAIGRNSTPAEGSSAVTESWSLRLSNTDRTNNLSRGFILPISATIPARLVCASEVRAMSTVVPAEDLAPPIQTVAARLGRWIAPLLAVLAATAFALGVTTPPRSGPFCVSQCIAYPYNDVVQFVPRDYVWMLPGTLLLPLFVVLAGCIHASIGISRRVSSLVGLCLASIAAGIITLDYFTQFQVVVPSLLRGESGGLALFTQYNPHGFFIALEDLGYLMLSAAFLFVGAAFGNGTRLELAIRWTFIGAAMLAFACFAGMTWRFGFDVEYRFEVAIITITWTALVVAGVLLTFFFLRSGSATRRFHAGKRD